MSTMNEASKAFSNAAIIASVTAEVSLREFRKVGHKTMLQYVYKPLLEFINGISSVESLGSDRSGCSSGDCGGSMDSKQSA